jgi:hypothetical protein
LAVSAVAALSAVVALRAADAPPAEPAGKPKLVIEKEAIDVGEVVRGTDAKFVFVVKNTGDALLKITSAKPG